MDNNNSNLLTFSEYSQQMEDLTREINVIRKHQTSLQTQIDYLNKIWWELADLRRQTLSSDAQASDSACQQVTALPLDPSITFEVLVRTTRTEHIPCPFMTGEMLEVKVGC